MLTSIERPAILDLNASTQPSTLLCLSTSGPLDFAENKVGAESL